MPAAMQARGRGVKLRLTHAAVLLGKSTHACSDASDGVLSSVLDDPLDWSTGRVLERCVQHICQPLPPPDLMAHHGCSNLVCSKAGIMSNQPSQ
jgi:hypothetical protein